MAHGQPWVDGLPDRRKQSTELHRKLKNPRRCGTDDRSKLPRREFYHGFVTVSGQGVRATASTVA